MKKLSISELLRRVDAGDTYAEIARDYDITRQAVYKRVVALRGKTTKPGLEKGLAAFCL